MNKEHKAKMKENIIEIGKAAFFMFGCYLAAFIFFFDFKG